MVLHQVLSSHLSDWDWISISIHGCHLISKIAAPAPAFTFICQPKERQGKRRWRAQSFSLQKWPRGYTYHFWSHSISQNLVVWLPLPVREMQSWAECHVEKQNSYNYGSRGELPLKNSQQSMPQVMKKKKIVKENGQVSSMSNWVDGGFC